MFASLSQWIRLKIRSKPVLFGIAAVAAAAVAGWTVAGSGRVAGPVALTSAQRNTPPASGSPDGQGQAPPAGAQQSSARTNTVVDPAGPDGSKKHLGRHHQNSTACPPPPGTTVQGGLLVDGDCTTSNVTINGGVVITGTGHLTLYKSTVNGGVTVQRDGEFDSDFPTVPNGGNVLNGGVSETNAFDMDIFNGIVQGSIHYNGGPTGGGSFQDEVCGTTLRGDVTIENMIGFAVEFGDVTPAAHCAPNMVTGSVHIRSNDSHSVELENDTIGGSVEILDSHPAVTGVTIEGSLLCHKGATLGHYDADDSNPNTVHGMNTCS